MPRSTAEAILLAAIWAALAAASALLVWAWMAALRTCPAAAYAMLSLWVTAWTCAALRRPRRS